MKRLFEIDSWKIIETDLHKEDFRLAESIMSLGNGHMGMRGNFEEHYSGDFHRGSYIAGVWFPDKTRVGWWKNGYPEYFGKVINSVNFIGIRLFLNGEELDLNTAEVKEYYRELDMQHGILTRKFSVLHAERETEIEAVRFLSVAERELAVIKYSVTAKNYNGKITFIPYLDGDVRNEDSNYEEDFWHEIENSSSEYEAYLVMKTKGNPFGTPTFQVAASMKIAVDAPVLGITANRKEEYVDNVIEVTADQGKTINLYKFVGVTTDRDYEAGELVGKGREVIARSLEKGFETLLGEHKQTWLKRWERADVEIAGDGEAQQGIRFNLFQLFSTYYGEDSRLNIGPKGFTGEKYGGATYWDTEAYAFCFNVPNQLLNARQQVRGCDVLN